MTRINQLFSVKRNHILSMFITAGYPGLNDTIPIVKVLEKSGVDMIEIGMPFSDPLADGPTIQQSSQKAIENGMTLQVLFGQLKNIRLEVKIPLILMGYFNPVFYFGVEKFLKNCRETGIDGVIIPDLPMQEYTDEYQNLFEQYQIQNIFLITPQSDEERVRKIDAISHGFIYMVSSSSTTGAKSAITKTQIEYFERIKMMKLKNPVIIGFGISNHQTFSKACEYANGAIIASAYIKKLAEEKKDILKTTEKFIKGIIKPTSHVK